jgi:hypothetical protein
VNLPLAVLASVPVGVVTGLGLVVFGGEFLDQIVAYFGDFLATLEQQLSEGNARVALDRPDALQIAGMMGAGTALTSVLCLLLARYWQAALYNPGGFGQEFKALYYPPVISAALALAGVILVAMGMQYRSWAIICAIPLTFVGLALVHARASWRGQGKGWLAAFYVALLFFDLVKLLLVLAAIADSWFNFRRRWTGSSSTGVSERDKDEDL